ncbi:hypothetical protein ACFYRN_24130 [Streptomyces sp. NPDC005227]|uniref:hypothetical protein n=1 Tax=unclassified Streptomyces TaxID=2593676 RepID=UPI00368A99ED
MPSRAQAIEEIIDDLGGAERSAPARILTTVDDRVVTMTGAPQALPAPGPHGTGIPIGAPDVGIG